MEPTANNGVPPEAAPNRTPSILIWLTDDELARVDALMRAASARKRGRYARALVLGEDPRAPGEPRPQRSAPPRNVRAFFAFQALAEACVSLAGSLRSGWPPGAPEVAALRAPLAALDEHVNALRLALLGIAVRP